MARILGVGIATLDIINLVEAYPVEDDEVRAREQRVERGGNTANLVVVLAQLGHRCAWAGTLADEPDAARIRTDLERHGVDLATARTLAHGKVPTSYITSSRANGSRTIVHYRDLPEYRAEDFAAIELGERDWLHLEGRNLEATPMMLARARRERPALPISVEVEKPRAGIEALAAQANLVLFSRAYARSRGFDDGAAFLEAMRAEMPGADLVCGWGEAGAFALSREGRAHASPAFPPARVVDTLGAGDTLNAGIIDAILGGRELGEALVAGCRLAGRKCGQHGFDGLGQHVGE